jgi:hypothetical protein
MLKQSTMDTTRKIANDGVKRMPHERDETPDGQDNKPRSVGKQAASDIERGLVDTDMHNKRTLEDVKPTPPHPAGAQPQPGSKRD